MNQMSYSSELNSINYALSNVSIKLKIPNVTSLVWKHRSNSPGDIYSAMVNYLKNHQETINYLTENETVVFKYQDEEGDDITVGSTEDLLRALEFAIQHNKNKLTLNVCKKLRQTSLRSTMIESTPLDDNGSPADSYHYATSPHISVSGLSNASGNSRGRNISVGGLSAPDLPFQQLSINPNPVSEPRSGMNDNPQSEPQLSAKARVAYENYNRNIRNAFPSSAQRRPPQSHHSSHHSSEEERFENYPYDSHRFQLPPTLFGDERPFSNEVRPPNRNNFPRDSNHSDHSLKDALPRDLFPELFEASPDAKYSNGYFGRESPRPLTQAEQESLVPSGILYPEYESNQEIPQLPVTPTPDKEGLMDSLPDPMTQPDAPAGPPYQYRSFDPNYDRMQQYMPQRAPVERPVPHVSPRHPMPSQSRSAEVVPTVQQHVSPKRMRSHPDMPPHLQEPIPSAQRMPLSPTGQQLSQRTSPKSERATPSRERVHPSVRPSTQVQPTQPPAASHPSRPPVGMVPARQLPPQPPAQGIQRPGSQYPQRYPPPGTSGHSPLRQTYGEQTTVSQVSQTQSGVPKKVAPKLIVKRPQLVVKNTLPSKGQTMAQRLASNVGGGRRTITTGNGSLITASQVYRDKIKYRKVLTTHWSMFVEINMAGIDTRFDEEDVRKCAIETFREFQPDLGRFTNDTQIHQQTDDPLHRRLFVNFSHPYNRDNALEKYGRRTIDGKKSKGWVYRGRSYYFTRIGYDETPNHVKPFSIAVTKHFPVEFDWRKDGRKNLREEFAKEFVDYEDLTQDPNTQIQIHKKSKHFLIVRINFASPRARDRLWLDVGPTGEAELLGKKIVFKQCEIETL